MTSSPDHSNLPGERFGGPSDTHGGTGDVVAIDSVKSFCVSLSATPSNTEDTTDELPAQDELQADANVSQLVDRFRIDKLIGRGGFGEVWQAYDKVRREPVAIKAPRRDRRLTPALVDVFVREAQKSMDLGDSRVVPVLEVVQSSTGRPDEFICFIVMKLMQGSSLARRLEEGERPSFEQAVTWVAELADTLAEIHSQGLIHRDIKPDNILFDEKGRPYFSDFGLAASVSEQLGEPRQVLGTVSFMAPEQARKQHVDRQADIYSLGVVLYQLLALPQVAKPQLALPYLAKTADEYFESLADPNQHPRTLPQQVPQPLADIVEGQCVCDDKTRRYRLATDLSRDLRAWLQASRPPRRMPRWAIAATVLTLVIAAGAALAVGPWWRPPPAETAPTEPSPTEPRPTPPEPAPAQLVAGTWNKLLDRPLPRLHWPAAGSGAEMVARPELEELTIVVNGVGLLEAGQTNHRNYTLRVRFVQPAWSGKFGIFYGLQPQETGFACGRLQLVRWVDGVGRPTFRIDRDDLLLDDRYFPINTSGRASAQVDGPDGEQELILIIRDGAVEKVSWGGRILADLLVDHLPTQPPPECRGKFGIYIERGSLTVSQFRIFLDEDDVADEQP